MARYGTLIAAAVAMLVAGWDLVREGTEEASQLSIVAMTVGLILIGSWLAIELYHLWEGGANQHLDEEEEDI